MALRFTGFNHYEVGLFVGKKCFLKNKKLYIRTKEGDLLCTNGSFIVRGVKGEFYSCKPDIFKKTYERELR